MSGAPVNFNRVRKAKARVEKKVEAAENSMKFGQSKARKDLGRAERAKARRDLDRHRLGED